MSFSRRTALKLGSLTILGAVGRASAEQSGLTERGLRRVPDSDITYYLIPYDSEGKERSGDDGTLVSRKVLSVLKNEPITDVFIFSHGWRGDYKEAIRQYDAWVGEMAKCEDDIAVARRVRQGFKPLLVGLHWPSLPLGLK